MLLNLVEQIGLRRATQIYSDKCIYAGYFFSALDNAASFRAKLISAYATAVDTGNANILGER